MNKSSNIKKNQKKKSEITILGALAQIQSTVTSLERKYNDIEAKITDAPKTYAESSNHPRPLQKTPKLSNELNDVNNEKPYIKNEQNMESP